MKSKVKKFNIFLWLSVFAISAQSSMAATQCIINISKSQCLRLEAEITQEIQNAKSLSTETECFSRLAGLRARCQMKLPASAQFIVDGKVVSENFSVRTNYGKLMAPIAGFLLR